MTRRSVDKERKDELVIKILMEQVWSVDHGGPEQGRRRANGGAVPRH